MTDPNPSFPEGKLSGALNVCISNDLNHYTGGKSNIDTAESFINYGNAITLTNAQVPRQPDDGLLSHEIGHQFGYSAAKFGGMRAESLVESANDALRNGRTTITEYVHPARGPRIGSITRELPAIAVYRTGAKRFAPTRTFWR